MGLIISPPAPRPGRSLSVRTSSHPSRGGTEKKKNPPNSRQFFSLHSKQSSEKINMHSHRKNCLYSGNGQPNPFRSIIPPIDMEGGGGGSVRRSWTNRVGPGASPRPASWLGVFVSSWMPRGPQLLVRAPRASILSVSAAETK